jgi:hypothetical protein
MFSKIGDEIPNSRLTTGIADDTDSKLTTGAVDSER